MTAKDGRYNERVADGEPARARGFKTKNAFFVTLVQEEKQRRAELLDLYQQQQELKKKMAAARQAAEAE